MGHGIRRLEGFGEEPGATQAYGRPRRTFIESPPSPHDGPRGRSPRGRPRVLVSPPRVRGEPDGGRVRRGDPDGLRTHPAGRPPAPRGREDVAGVRGRDRVRVRPGPRPPEHREPREPPSLLRRVARRPRDLRPPPVRGPPRGPPRRIHQASTRARAGREGPRARPVRLPDRDVPRPPPRRPVLVVRPLLDGG